MLHVLTTVSSHPKGLDLHLRNLRWALDGCEYRIHVQTFEHWCFSGRDVSWVARKAPTDSGFYLFWNEAADYLGGFLDAADAFLFMEQDIFFTRPALDQLETCRRDGLIVLNLESPYQSVYRSKAERVYPRIWEGATFIPAALLADAIEAKITLGHVPGELRPGSSAYPRYRDKLESHYTCRGDPEPTEFLPLTEILSRRYVEVLFEFSLYCFCTERAFESVARLDRGYELGNAVVHFRNPESVHRDYPRVYDDASEMHSLGPWCQPRLNDLALMFLLSEALPPTDALADLLQSRAGLELCREKSEQFGRRAADWMSASEYERFQWARRLLDRTPSGP